MDALIVYALTIYMLFHVLTRSDILAKPRVWVLRVCPGWLTYPASCVFCFTWWSTWILGFLGMVSLNLATLCAAPVINMVLDLVVKALIRANEPPVLLPAVLRPTWDDNTPNSLRPGHLVGVVSPAKTADLAGYVPIKLDL